MNGYKLPGDLEEIKTMLGMEAVRKLVNRFGGSYVNIPKCDELMREIRNEEIRNKFDKGKRIRQLVWEYQLTDRQIRAIVNSTAKEEVPPPLYALMQSKKS